MADAPHLRISDQDRERAAAAIREHYAAGRLDSGEFEERTQAVYAARTRGELDALSADLPALPPPPPTTAQLIRSALTQHGAARYAAAGGGLFLVCTAVWALDGAGHGFWPGWVLVLSAFSVMRRRRRGAGRRRDRASDGGAADGGASGGGHSYHYEYHYGDGRREHRHEHLE